MAAEAWAPARARPPAPAERLTLVAAGARTVDDRREVLITGVSHRTAPLEAREALAIPSSDLALALSRLRREARVPEAMILSTCNRVELYAAGDPSAAEAMAEFLLKRPDASKVGGGNVYRLQGVEAVRHAFRVASGLDSQVLGEAQILGQVKEAYRAAQRSGALGPILGALRHRTLAAAKRVRTETGIGRHAVSISHVAVELARKIFDRLVDRNVLLVGAGKMCRLAARRLVREGARITVLGRTVERALDLATALGGRAAGYEALREELARADIVIAGTGAPVTVIARADVEGVRRGRGARPLFLIDIAVPRDIDPAVRSLEGVFLYDLDDLKSVAQANLRERQREAARAEALVERETCEFRAWQGSQEAVPLLVELRRHGDRIRRAEVEKALRLMGPLTPMQEQALDAVTTAIVNKLLHPPTVHLKRLASEGRIGEYAGLVRSLLGLSREMPSFVKGPLR